MQHPPQQSALAEYPCLPPGHCFDANHQITCQAQRTRCYLALPIWVHEDQQFLAPKSLFRLPPGNNASLGVPGDLNWGQDKGCSWTESDTASQTPFSGFEKPLQCSNWHLKTKSSWGAKEPSPGACGFLAQDLLPKTQSALASQPGCIAIGKMPCAELQPGSSRPKGAVWWYLGAVPHIQAPASPPPPAAHEGGPAHICCWPSHLQWIIGLAPAQAHPRCRFPWNVPSL